MNAQPPSAGQVLRRALLVWGAGHIALGDRRGWLLVVLQALAIAALLLLATLLIEGTRWLVVLLAFAVFFVFWIGQAIDAHRRALAAGRADGGELQIVALLPLAVALLAGFWLIGGDYGSPGATLQHYVSAWQADQPASAATLLDEPVEPDELHATWQLQTARLRLLVADAQERYGAQSGLDPERPFNSLRFEEIAEQRAGGRAVVAVDLVRRERYETELFGLIPTAAQRTVLVRRLGFVRLHSEPATAPAWLPAGQTNPSRVWRIDEVSLDLRD